MEMDPGWGIGRSNWLEIFTGPRLVNPDGVLVGNSGRPLGWGNQMDFWSENIKVNCSVKWVEMWSGGPNKDVAWFNGWVWAW